MRGLARSKVAEPLEVEDSRQGLQGHDTTVLFGFVPTPIVRVRGPTQLPGVESERCRVRGVRVGLHDVPSEGAEYDAVAGPWTDPPHGADRAACSGVWQRARDIVADGPRGFAVHTAEVLVELMIRLLCHLQTIAMSLGEVERTCGRGPAGDVPWQAGEGHACLVASDVKVH
jgi:hypothetical protein